MKTIFTIVFLVTGAISFKAQDKLQEAGFYDSKITIIETKIAGKTIVSFPMKHAGTEKFYSDIKSKIDSLKKEEYYFLFEQVKVDGKDQLMRKKLKKITGNINISREKGYVNLLKDYGIKMKEELIDQPSYDILGLDSSISTNLDVTGADIVNYYEKTYGEIKLNKCELDNSILEKDNCGGKNLKEKYRRDAIVHYRDEVIAKGALNDKHSKIVLLYGQGHTEGIISELRKMIN